MDDYYQLDSLNFQQLTHLYPASAAFVKGGKNSCADLITFIHCHLTACSVEQEDLPSKLGPWTGVVSFWLKLFSQPTAEHLREYKHNFLRVLAKKCVHEGQLTPTDAVSADDSNALGTSHVSEQLGTMPKDSLVTMETKSQPNWLDKSDQVKSVKCEPLSSDSFPSTAVEVPADVVVADEDSAANEPTTSPTPPVDCFASPHKDLKVPDVDMVTVFSLAGLEDASLLEDSVRLTEELVEVKQEKVDEGYNTPAFVFTEAEKVLQSPPGLVVSSRLEQSPASTAVSSTASSNAIVKTEDGAPVQTSTAGTDTNSSTFSMGPDDESTTVNTSAEPFYCCSCEVTHFKKTHQCFLCQVNGSTCSYNYSCCSYNALITHQQSIHPGDVCSHEVTGHASNDVSETGNAPGKVVSQGSSNHIFRCRHCAFTSPTESELKCHMSLTHAEVSTPPNICEDCGKVFGVDHVMPFRCSYWGCEFKTCLMRFLEVHRKISGHRKGENAAIVSQEIEQTPQVSDDDRHLQAMARLDASATPFVPQANGRKIYKPNKLVAINGKYKCPACDYLAAPFKQSMALHINKVHKSAKYEIQLKKSLFPCHKCGAKMDKQHTYDWLCTCINAKKFCRITDFKDHVVRYHRDIEIIPNIYKLFCPLCEWSHEGSMSSSMLREHLQWHGRSCQLCEGWEYAPGHGYTLICTDHQSQPYVSCTRNKYLIKVKMLLVGRTKTADAVLPDGITLPAEDAHSSTNATIISYAADPGDLLEKSQDVDRSSPLSLSNDSSDDHDISGATNAFFKVPDGSNTFPCYYCSSQCDSITEIDAHIANMHVEVHKYTCRLCPSFKASRKTIWTSHMASAHNVCTHLVHHVNSSAGYYSEELANGSTEALCSVCASKTDKPRKKLVEKRRRNPKKRKSCGEPRQIVAGGVMGSREAAAVNSSVVDEERAASADREDAMAMDNDYLDSSVSDDSDEDYQPTANSKRHLGRSAEKRKLSVSLSPKQSKKNKIAWNGSSPGIQPQLRRLISDSTTETQTSQKNCTIAKTDQKPILKVVQRSLYSSTHSLKRIISPPRNPVLSAEQRLVHFMGPKNGNQLTYNFVGPNTQHKLTTAPAKVIGSSIVSTPSVPSIQESNVSRFPQTVVRSKLGHKQNFQIITLAKNGQPSYSMGTLVSKPSLSSAVPMAPSAKPQTAVPIAPWPVPQTVAPVAPSATPHVAVPIAPSATPRVAVPIAPPATPRVAVPIAPSATPRAAIPIAPSAKPQVAVPIASLASPQTAFTSAQQFSNSFPIDANTQPGSKPVVTFIKSVHHMQPTSAAVSSTLATIFPQKEAAPKIPRIVTVTASTKVSSALSKTSANTSN